MVICLTVLPSCVVAVLLFLAPVAVALRFFVAGSDVDVSVVEVYGLPKR
jgi:hypothetical protein